MIVVNLQSYSVMNSNNKMKKLVVDNIAKM